MATNHVLECLYIYIVTDRAEKKLETRESARLGEVLMPERARAEPTFIARSNSEPSRLASRPDHVVLYCDTVTFIPYYVIDLVLWT
jgi:hypothetical protein